jgi:hypothetical protein
MIYFFLVAAFALAWFVGLAMFIDSLMYFRVLSSVSIVMILFSFILIERMERSGKSMEYKEFVEYLAYSREEKAKYEELQKFYLSELERLHEFRRSMNETSIKNNNT